MPASADLAAEVAPSLVNVSGIQAGRDANIQISVHDLPNLGELLETGLSKCPTRPSPAGLLNGDVPEAVEFVK